MFGVISDFKKARIYSNFIYWELQNAPSLIPFHGQRQTKSEDRLSNFIGGREETERDPESQSIISLIKAKLTFYIVNLQTFCCIKIKSKERPGTILNYFQDDKDEESPFVFTIIKKNVMPLEKWWLFLTFLKEQSDLSPKSHGFF